MCPTHNPVGDRFIERLLPGGYMANRANATRCVIRVRHSLSVQEGPNEARTLTLQGVFLCRKVREKYLTLIMVFERQFGKAVFASSPFPRALLTAFLVTEAENIHIDDRLGLELSVKKAPAPPGSTHANLYDHWKSEGLTLSEMISRLADDLSLFGDQPVEMGLAKSEDFNKRAFPESNLIVAFGHEPGISLLANGFVKKEDLGLNECQAFVFFYDANGKCVGVEKF